MSDGGILLNVWWCRGLSLMRRCRAGLLFEHCFSEDGLVEQCRQAPLACPILSVLGTADTIQASTAACGWALLF